MRLRGRARGLFYRPERGELGVAVAAIEFLAEVMACVFRLQGRDKEGELDEQGMHEEHWSRVSAVTSARRLALDGAVDRKSVV